MKIYQTMLLMTLMSTTLIQADANQELLAGTEAGSLVQIKKALAKGADINTQGPLGMTPLMMASALNKLEIVKFLLEKNANIDAATNEGLTALILASSPKVVTLLLQNHANINAKTVLNGATALIIASFNGKLDTVQALLAYNPDINIKDNDGETALDKAQHSGNKELQALLRSHGAKHGKDLP